MRLLRSCRGELALCAGTLLLAPLAWADPVSITHSGYLLDGSDTPVTGTVAMTFALYDVAGGGSPLWMGLAAGGSSCQVPVRAGKYSVVLGSSDSGACGTGLSDSHWPSGASRWLEVSVGGIPLLPRLPLRPVPMALVSADTQALKQRLTTAGTLNTASNPVDWTQLKNVPPGLADGIDDTLQAVAHDASLSGDGRTTPLGVASLDASVLSSGLIAGARLGGIYPGAVSFTHPGNVFVGDGAGLTHLQAANLEGQIPASALPSTLGNATQLGGHDAAYFATASEVAALRALLTPTVTSVDARACAGMPVQITGTSLTGATGVVLSNGTALTGTINASGAMITGLSIPASVPSGTYDVIVQTPLGNTAPTALSKVVVVGTPTSTVSAGTFSEPSTTVSSTSAGATSLTVGSASGFAECDEALLVDLKGSAWGRHEPVRIKSVAGNTVTLYSGLQNTYPAGDAIVLQRFMQGANVSIGSGTTITAPAWDGSKGGIIAVRASSAITLGGTLDATGAGFRGGVQQIVNNQNGEQGESYTGTQSRSTSPNNAGGGGGANDQRSGDTVGGGGGGGGASTAGGGGGGVTSCYGSIPSSGGPAFTLDLSSKVVLGSGGGSGGTDEVAGGGRVGGNGGRGGGLVLLWAPSVTISGTVLARGTAGTAGGVDGGGGGGGAGGTIVIRRNSGSTTGTLTVTGGSGGATGYPQCASDGGTGGTGFNGTAAY